MTPTEGIVFISKIENNPGEFEVVGTKVGRCQVTHCGSGVTACRPDDYIIFSDFQEYDYLDEKIIAVKESDIVGVAHA